MHADQLTMTSFLNAGYVLTCEDPAKATRPLHGCPEQHEGHNLGGVQDEESGDQSKDAALRLQIPLLLLCWAQAVPLMLGLAATKHLR